MNWQTLKESEARFRRLSEATFEGIVIHDNGRILDVNQTMVQMFGFRRSELINKHIMDFLTLETHDIILHHPYAGDNYLYEGEGRKKDGAVFPIEIRLKTLPYQNHTVGIVTIRDISRYQQAKELLRKLEKAFETTEVGITITDNDGRIVYTNPADAKMHGYTVNELIGQYAAIFAPSEYRKDPTDQEAEKQTFLYWKRERINVRKDGSTFPVRLISNPITDTQEHSIGKVTICEDMSAYKKAEDALKAEHNLLHTLIDHLPDLIYVKDPKSRYLLANEATLRFMAVTDQDELLGKTDFDFHPLEMAEQYYADEQAILDSGQPLINREEPVIDQQTGSIRWLLSTRVPFRDSQGNIAGLVGINRDITERKRMEAQLLTAHAELKEKNDQLAKLNASKDKFFSIISHDLRSPLNVVLGYSQLIHEDYDTSSSEEIKLYVKDLRESAEKLYALLENLLTWSRVQRGAMEYSPEDLELSELTEEALDLFFSQADQKQITLHSSVESEIHVYADYQMVSTILRNLLSNALKFTSSGGCVEVSARRNDTHVEVAVSDTGVGIRNEDISKLFRIDVRYTHVGTAGEEGTGLGLSLCKELVEKNRGTIWVESEIEKGTTFRFTLPQEPGSLSKTAIFHL